MTTICPNCLRPVRTDAKYCGFCGSSLIAEGVVESKAVPLSTLDEAVIEAKPAVPERPKRTRKEIRRIVLIILIILLCLVLLLAFVVHFWPVIIPYFGQILSFVRLR